jgi:hypothetical protein
VQPSSLVFLAIVALWAAYLLPQWIRRRDLFAHWRDQDHGTGGQRILDPRRQREHGRSTEPLLGAGRAGTTPVAGDDSTPTDGPDCGTASMESDPVGEHPERDRGPAMTLSARRRARVLLGLGSLWAVSGVGTVLGAPVAMPVVLSVLLVAYLVALRVVAVRQLPRRPVTAEGQERSAETGRQTARSSTGRPVRSGSVREARHAAAVAARRRAAAAEALSGQEPVASTELTEDEGWEPTPVPVPTYTLKPMAPRPEPAALDLSTMGYDSAAPVESSTGSGADSTEAIPGDQESGPASAREAASGRATGKRRPWEEDHQWADDLDLDAVLARRRAVNG